MKAVLTGFYDSMYQTWEIRRNSKQEKVCFLCRKHKQPIKRQPMKMLWHIRSLSRLRKSATNLHEYTTATNVSCSTCVRISSVTVLNVLTRLSAHNKVLIKRTAEQSSTITT